MNTISAAPAAAMHKQVLTPPLAALRFGDDEVRNAATAIIAAAEYDLPGDPEQPDFDDDSEDETDADEEEAGPSSWEHHRLR